MQDWDLWTKPPVMVVSFLGGMDVHPADHCKESPGKVGRGRERVGTGEQDRQAGPMGGAFPVMSDRDPQLRLLTPTPTPSPWQQEESGCSREERQDLSTGMPFSPAWEPWAGAQWSAH